MLMLGVAVVERATTVLVSRAAAPLGGAADFGERTAFLAFARAFGAGAALLGGLDVDLAFFAAFGAIVRLALRLGALTGVDTYSESDAPERRDVLLEAGKE